MSPIDLFKAGVIFGLFVYVCAKKELKDSGLGEKMS